MESKLFMWCLRFYNSSQSQLFAYLELSTYLELSAYLKLSAYIELSAY